MSDCRRIKIPMAILLGFPLIFGLAAASGRSAAEGTASQVGSQASSGQNVSTSREMIRQFSEAFESAAAKVSGAIVSIYAEQVVQVQNPFGSPDDPFRQFFGDYFFKRFFGPQEQKQTIRSLGSGVIVSSDGHILTNNHVVAKAQKLYVVIGDKKRYVAKVVGADPPTDVAVIKIDAANLPTAVLGDSDQVKVGQWFIAVGNPFQLLHTVTAGIISAKGRSSVGLATYEDFFQTDASINPGNSGGALADLDGNVIGINTAIESPSGGNIGIGFAIPINMAKQVMTTLLAKGKVLRGYMGLSLQSIDEELAKALKLSNTSGALVASVVAGGPADQGGIKQGDVIIALEGRPVTDRDELRNRVAQVPPGTTVKVSILRNGRESSASVVLGSQPSAEAAPADREQAPRQSTSQRLGLTVQTLSPELADQLGYKSEQGAVITDVAAGSAAEDAGLQRGDLIKQVNRVDVRDAGGFENALRKITSGDTAALLVRRGSNSFYVPLQVR
jgi:serine protease Do